MKCSYEIDFTPTITALRLSDLYTVGPWPGRKSGGFHTLYPNLLAELSAKETVAYYENFAYYAGVSIQVMAAVIEDGEPLTQLEQERLSLRWERRISGYLFSPYLQCVDPTTNKGKRRRRELQRLFAAAKANGIDIYYKDKWIMKFLNDGDPVTYASYWWACDRIKRDLENVRRKANTRMGRLEAAG